MQKGTEKGRRTGGSKGYGVRGNLLKEIRIEEFRDVR